MPYINIRLGTTLNRVKRENLHQKTTYLMSSIMGKRQEVTTVHIQEDSPQQWAINSVGLNTESPIGAYVAIKVTKGTNTPAEKANMISETIKMLKNEIGTIQEACYVVIDEVPANSWGYNGKTQAERATSKL